MEIFKCLLTAQLSSVSSAWNF